MLIPKFWAKAQTQSYIGKTQTPVTLTCWRWSNIDINDALTVARLAVEERAMALASGKSARADYAPSPIREEILQELKDSRGQLLGIITRSNLGFSVLNTDRLMFIDIDQRKNAFARIQSFFGKTQSVEEERVRFEAQASELLEKIYARHQVGGRLYRTAKGLRAMVTSREMSATDTQSASILKECHADKLYLRLCEAQKCFRARLSPKPYRLKMKAPQAKFPDVGDAEQAAHAEWLARYHDAAGAFSVCHYLKDIGTHAENAPELHLLVKMHDEFTQVSSAKILA